MRRVAISPSWLPALALGLVLSTQLGAADATTGFEGIVRRSGSPATVVPEATIHLRRIRPLDEHVTSGYVRADASGAFRAEGIPPGLYALRIDAEGYQSRDDASVEVVDDAVTQVDIEVTPLPPEPKQDMSFMVIMLGGLVILIAVMLHGHNRIRRMKAELESDEEWHARTFPSGRSQDRRDQ